MTIFEFMEKHNTLFYDTKLFMQLAKHHKVPLDKIIDLADQILDRDVFIFEKDLIDEISKELKKT
ncbi:hypothetical protein [Aliarcobacter cryaerophilus]|uniref:hypothetical protein n=1 Tax=Aliarcobacter cryaerophilus TaxID=28198 RepID=UPI003DA451A0